MWICRVPPRLQRKNDKREREREKRGKERQKNERTDDREFAGMIWEGRKGRRSSRLSVDELGRVHGVSVIQNAICIGGACLRKSQMRSD